MYWDANNLYSWVIPQYLAVAKFEWLDASIINQYIILSQADDADYGYVLEVDLSYSSQLYHLHNEYPFSQKILT